MQPDREQSKGIPRSPPIDSQDGKDDHNPMEKRIEKLEDSAGDANQRLARIETRVDGIDQRLATRMATKADVSEAKAVIVASISTMVALAAIVFAIARYFPAS